MLFTLGLLLLLTPFPSFQTTTSERRNSTGSDVTKANAAFTLSKPKTTSTLLKQTVRSTLRPNTVNQTVLPTPATNQKSHTINAMATTKSKTIQAVIQTAAATGTMTNKDKHTATAPASGAKTAKGKLQQLVNQTVSVRSPAATDGKLAKDKAASTAVQNTQSTSSTSVPASGAKTTKNKPTASVNQTVVAKSASTGDVKEKPVPLQPIKVVMVSDDCDSNKGKEQEVKLKPTADLVMTHKISLVPGACTGACVAEMSALKGRVARLEREMSFFKTKCPCSASCPNDCSGNGECEKGKCVCHQWFDGPDCSQCARGRDCTKRVVKGKAKDTMDAVTQQRKDQRLEEVDSKLSVTTNLRPGLSKTQAKQDVSVKKVTTTGSTKTTVTSRPTVGQVLLKHEGRKQAEARKGKTIVSSRKVALKTFAKSDQLKDEPHANVTLQGNTRRSNGTVKYGTTVSKTMGTNKTRTGEETLEQSTLAEKNATQTSGQKRIKTVIVENINMQTTDNRNNEAAGKITQKSQYIINTTLSATPEQGQASQRETSMHGSGVSKGIGGTGLGSVKVENISSYSFTVTWLAPQGMFKNFTVIRREPQAEGEEEEPEDFEAEALGTDMVSADKNTAEIYVQTESKDTTVAFGKTTGSRTRAETKRISMVVPGSVRSVEFSNLRANTRYILYVYATGAERRSKIHRVSAVTGPEPPTEIVFSDVTETSLNVSWTKPKTMFAGFRVSYANIVTGESHFVMVDSQQSSFVLSKLSAGTSYIVSVTTTHSRVQSDALIAIITTVPAPPTRLEIVNVTDTRAVLQWTPSLGKVDRFIISYESSKTPNVTVTVMVSGNSVEHQLRGLQRGTMYTVKVLSQKDSLQSMAIATTFTTANVVKAGEVGARSAVITWKHTTIVYHSYRIIYQVVGEEAKEVILDSTVTEYKLTGLLPTSRYMVLVQGERDRQYTSIVTTEFITGKLRFPYPTECSQELLNGALQSGEVDIYPQGREGQAVRVYCDMETDGGGWTVFQRRMNGKTDFYRTWSEYRAGFGNLSEEFWLGNELLHNLTSIGPVSLRVDMHFGNETAYAHYANFSIDSEEKKYTLTLSGYTGTAGDSMKYHNGRSFSTKDRDTDPLGIHCARAYMGGWWYKNCYKTNLNGLYGINSNNQGVVWIDWKGKNSSIPFIEMKFRPSRFSPATHG